MVLTWERRAELLLPIDMDSCTPASESSDPSSAANIMSLCLPGSRLAHVCHEPTRDKDPRERHRGTMPMERQEKESVDKTMGKYIQDDR